MNFLNFTILKQQFLHIFGATKATVFDYEAIEELIVQQQS